MENNVKVDVDDLIKWLNKNAGGRAGVSAADGMIAIFDQETGETMETLSVERHIVNNTK
jgi:hypothetical protein